MTGLISYEIAVLPVIRPQCAAGGTWVPTRLTDTIAVTAPFTRELSVTVELHAPLHADRVEVCRLGVGNEAVLGDHLVPGDWPIGQVAYSTVPTNDAISVALEYLRLSLSDGFPGDQDEQLIDVARRVIDRYDRLGLSREPQPKTTGRPPKSQLRHARVAALWHQGRQLGVRQMVKFIGDRMEHQDGERPLDSNIRQWIYFCRQKGLVPPVSQSDNGPGQYAKTA